MARWVITWVVVVVLIALTSVEAEAVVRGRGRARARPSVSSSMRCGFSVNRAGNDEEAELGEVDDAKSTSFSGGVLLDVEQGSVVELGDASSQGGLFRRRRKSSLFRRRRKSRRRKSQRRRRKSKQTKACVKAAKLQKKSARRKLLWPKQPMNLTEVGRPIDTTALYFQNTKDCLAKFDNKVISESRVFNAVWDMNWKAFFAMREEVPGSAYAVFDQLWYSIGGAKKPRRSKGKRSDHLKERLKIFGECMPKLPGSKGKWKKLGVPSRSGSPCWGSVDPLEDSGTGLTHTGASFTLAVKGGAFTAKLVGKSPSDGSVCKLRAFVRIQECSNCCCDTLMTYKESFQRIANMGSRSFSAHCETWYTRASGAFSSFLSSAFKSKILALGEKRCWRVTCTNPLLAPRVTSLTIESNSTDAGITPDNSTSQSEVPLV